MTAQLVKSSVRSNCIEAQPNPEQQQAIDAFMNWFCDPRVDSLFELQGAAGCGKSFALAYMLKASKLKWSEVVLAAPCNRAAFVLQQALHSAGLPKFECKTIHSALGISVVDYDEFGNPIFDTKKGNSKKIEALKLLIIDEKSMIGADLLTAIKTLAPRSLKILFCGDSYQLPPVTKSAPLLLSKQNYEAASFGDPFTLSPTIGCAKTQNTAELQKIMRQDGGVAVDVLRSVRETITDADRFMADIYADPAQRWSFEPSLRVFSDERDDSFQEYSSRTKLMEKAIDLFSQRKRVKLIAYKNKSVKYFQEAIFSRLFTNAETPYPVGAYIQLKEHWKNGGNTIIVPAGCEGYVTESALMTAYFGGTEIQYYGLCVDFGELFGDVLLKVPTPESEVKISAVIETLKNSMSRESGHEYTPETSLVALYRKLGFQDEAAQVSPLANIDQALRFSHADIAREQGPIVLQMLQAAMLFCSWKNGWGFIYSLKSSLASIESGYACTIYKAQGSTYDEVLFYNDMPKFSISEWQLERNAIDLLKTKAKIDSARQALSRKRGHSEESYTALVKDEFERWLPAPINSLFTAFDKWDAEVSTKLDELLEQDQFLEAYTRDTRGMEPRLILRALYVAASRHKKALHFCDESA